MRLRRIYHFACEVCGTHITSGMTEDDEEANEILDQHIKIHTLAQLKDNAKLIERVTINIREE